MDLNHRSPGYEPDGISRLPHLVKQTAGITHFQTTDGPVNIIRCKIMIKSEDNGIPLSTSASYGLPCE